MPQCVVSAEVLTTHKVWGKVSFDHFQFCSILSAGHSFLKTKEKYSWVISKVVEFAGSSLTGTVAWENFSLILPQFKRGFTKAVVTRAGHFWAKSLRGQKRKRKIALTIFRLVFPWFVWWKHIRPCRCRSSSLKVNDLGFLELSIVNQHHSTATNSRRLHVYNSQTEHSGNGCVYGRTFWVQGFIANFWTLCIVRSNCLFIRSSKGVISWFAKNSTQNQQPHKSTCYYSEKEKQRLICRGNIKIDEKKDILGKEVPIVQTMDSSIHRINLYPKDKY